MKSQPGPKDINSANEIAIAALSFLAADTDRFGTFLALSGIDPGSIRQAAAAPGFLVGILDYLLNDEKLLLDFASGGGIPPRETAEARALLAGPDAP